MNTVNKPFRKKDAMQLVTGQPVYMDDVTAGLPDRQAAAFTSCKRHGPDDQHDRGQKGARH